MDLDGQARIAMLLDSAEVPLGPLFGTPLGQFAIAAIEAEAPAADEEPVHEKPKKPRKTAAERKADAIAAFAAAPKGAPPKRSRTGKDAAAGDHDDEHAGQTDIQDAATSSDGPAPNVPQPARRRDETRCFWWRHP